MGIQIQELLQQDTKVDCFAYLDKHKGEPDKDDPEKANGLAEVFLTEVVAYNLTKSITGSKSAFEGYSDAMIDKYCKWCSEWVKKQLEKPQKDSKELPERVQKGFALAEEKGWLCRLENGKYQWKATIKGSGVMLGYFVGKLYNIEYPKQQFPKSVDDLFEGIKPYKNFLNFWQSTRKKEPTWKIQADELLNQI